MLAGGRGGGGKRRLGRFASAEEAATGRRVLNSTAPRRRLATVGGWLERSGLLEEQVVLWRLLLLAGLLPAAAWIEGGLGGSPLG